jgi:hypothetical protein
MRIQILGQRYRRFGRCKVRAVGGAIPIASGIKILIEHLGENVA